MTQIQISYLILQILLNLKPKINFKKFHSKIKKSLCKLQSAKNMEKEEISTRKCINIEKTPKRNRDQRPLGYSIKFGAVFLFWVNKL
jgi:hypothetical protein